jgi:hypothetical protein
MTSMRTVAYRRVMRTLRGVDAPPLSTSEQDRIREAADALLFCRDVDERWTQRRAQQLLDDIWACGPDLAEVARTPA